MLSNLLIEEIFPTPIGVVSCGLSSSARKIEVIGNKAYDNGKSIEYNTLSHNIELVRFKQRLPLYNGETVTDCQGWVWRISKENTDNESIELYCVLKDNPPGVRLGGSDPGEHLDSIVADSNYWTLHIGTEDGEIMQTRASYNDWMPARFKDRLDFSKSFTTVQTNGLITQVPELNAGERIYFHYLTAYDKYRFGTVNTWLAVDDYKRKLENWIGVW